MCRAMLKVIEQHAMEKACHHVSKVCLEVGQLAAIDQHALRFGFEAVTQGTIAEGATLEIVEIEGKAKCAFCNKTVHIKQYYDACEVCGHFSLHIIQGEGIQVKFMEVV